MQLILGDCIEEMRRLSDAGTRVDAIISDLPYCGVVKEDWDSFKNFEEYLDWVRETSEESFRILKENGTLVFFTSRQGNRKVCDILDEIGFHEQRIIIWNRKRGFNSTRGRALTSTYEPIAYYTKSPKDFIFNQLKVQVDSKRKEYTTGALKEGIALGDVWSDISALPHNSKEKVDHPTQKPVALMERIVKLFSNEGDTVLDFCMGSGTTGVACKNLNRNFIGIEKDEKYFEVARERINGTV